MTSQFWLIIGIACMIVFLQLMLFAWSQRHRDHFWRRFFRKKKPQSLPSCDNCRQGLAEIAQTTITGSWTCPVCGCPHSIVEGKPGVIDL